MDGFKLADSIRYIDDIKLKLKKIDPQFLIKYENQLALNSIKILNMLLMGSEHPG